MNIKEDIKLMHDGFDNLGMKSHLIDFPGHGNEAKVLGDIDSWEEIDNSL